MIARAGLCWVLGVAVVAAEGGKELAEKACAMCHVFPEPGLLDRASWRDGVLPRMGGLLGMNEVRDDDAPAGTYPEGPLLERAAWEAIVAYYLAEAPQALPGAGEGRLDLRAGAGWFEIEGAGRGGSPATTAVAVDEGRQVILAGDAVEKRLLIYDEELELEGVIELGGVPAEIRVEAAGQYLVTLIGREVGPNHRAEGKVVRVMPDGVVKVLASGLERPVAAVAGDWNGDGGEELVVSCFGFAKGGLMWVSGGRLDGAGVKVRDVGGGDFVFRLVDQPGAMGFSKASGLVLMAQGDERVVRVGGIGKLSGVEETNLLRFPPSYGVSSMTEADLDGDGDLDLVITAGDNGDDTPVFKPYHGVYFYENDGAGGFAGVAFLPMHGAYGAAVEDFDGDGDRDVVVVAYFADYEGGEEGVMVVENVGRWSFVPRTIAGIGAKGRFSVVAAGDVDGDDDVDVVLGNFPGGPQGPSGVKQVEMEGWLAGGKVTVLRNVTED